MTTELTTQRAGGLAEIHRTDDAAEFGSLVSMGDQLRRTGFLPAHIKNGVDFAAIVLMGREMGMGTMAACRKLQVIKGTVTERADSQLARFKSAGGRAEFKELSETRAVLTLRHPNGDQHTETFTIEDAKRAGLASNDNYNKHPKAMLRSRAITAGLKSVGWEGAVGIYDPDEVSEPEPAREPVVVRPRGTKPQPVADGITVHHVESFEPPTHTPDITTDQPSVVTLKSKRAAPEITDPVAKARLAVSRAKTLEDCDALRDLITLRHSEGVFTDADRDELKKLLHGKAEILIGSEEVAAHG
jgi:hypothetical protein